MNDPIVFDKLKEHLGHKITVVWYGEKSDPVNISVECEDCNEVLVDYDREGNED